MFLEMLAYLVWIGLTLAGMAGFFHMLHLDRPRPVQVPLRDRDTRR